MDIELSAIEENINDGMTAGRRERKKAQTRRAILSAAANLFSQRGYDQSSIDDIAEAADVAKRTLYNNFESKEEIVLALRFQYFETLIEKACRRADSGQSPLAAIENFVVESVRWTFEQPELARVLFRDGSMLPPPPKLGPDNSLQLPMPPFVHRLLELVLLSQKKGELRTDVETEFLVHLIGFIIVYTNLQAFRNASEKTSVKLARSCFHALLEGLKA